MSDENNLHEVRILQRIRDADVILGVDVVFRNQFIIFGREVLAQIRAGLSEGVALGDVRGGLDVLRCELDSGSDALSQVLDDVITAKGRHDFRVVSDDLDRFAHELFAGLESSTE